MTQEERDALVKEFVETAIEFGRIMSVENPRLDALGATSALAGTVFARGDEVLDALGVEASPLATIMMS